MFLLATVNKTPCKHNLIQGISDLFDSMELSWPRERLYYYTGNNILNTESLKNVNKAAANAPLNLNLLYV